MGSAAISVEGLTFTYDSEPVLEDVDVTVEPGEFVAIVGPNGGGKTTFLKLLLGLLEPTEGTVRVLGQRPSKVLRRVGYVPQVFQYDSAFPVTVGDVVRMGLLGSRRVRPKDEEDSVATALGKVGLAELASRPFSALSGGQRQRVLIARALATSPELLLLDEPTASVDGAVSQEIYALLRDLNQQMTILVVTHNLTFVSSVVESVLCINRHVLRHATMDPDQATGEYFQRTYGRDVRLVRHNVHCEECRQCVPEQEAERVD